MAVAIATQVEADQSKPVPVVQLGKEHYAHKSYGRIYTPLFAVQEWVGMDGEAKAEEAPEAIEAPVDAAPARRRRG